MESVGGHEGASRAVPADDALDSGLEEPGLAAATLGCASIGGERFIRQGNTVDCALSENMEALVAVLLHV